jgi:hypothetical protein
MFNILSTKEVQVKTTLRFPPTPVRTQSSRKQTSAGKDAGEREPLNTVEYYSTIKKNKIMPFAGKRMELEIIMLSKYQIFLSYWEARA